MSSLRGIEAEADLVGKMIGEWVIEEERNSLASFADFRLLIEQRKAEELRGYYRTKSGERIPILITGTEVLNGDGSPRAYVISARDVRDSKIMRTLRNSQSQLIKTAKLASLGELSAGIAHELNNPLMFVVGYNNRIKSALAKDDLPAREKILRYTEQIDEGADRMKTIIQSFLDFARQTETKREQMDVNSVIEKSINLVKEQLRLRSIRIKTELSNHPLLVMGEKVPLEQVMINFLTNARDAFSDIGDDIMKTVVVRTKEDDNRVMIEIEDNGVGIPSEIQDRMFDPFFTTKEPGKGTGLGMSITHKIIEDHGGKILLKSAPGEGARFTVVLPKPDVCDGGE